MIFIYRCWMKVAFFIGRIMTTLMFTIVYFLIIPFFLILKLKDPMRTRKSHAQSYWEDWPYKNETLEDFYYLS